MIHAKQNIGLNNIIETRLENLENPFEKAIRENERIENRQELERKKLNEFKLRVKKRLILYKHVETKLDEDFQLKIDLNSNKNVLKTKLNSQNIQNCVKSIFFYHFKFLSLISTFLHLNYIPG